MALGARLAVSPGRERAGTQTDPRFPDRRSARNAASAEAGRTTALSPMLWALGAGVRVLPYIVLPAPSALSSSIASPMR